MRAFLGSSLTCKKIVGARGAFDRQFPQYGTEDKKEMLKPAKQDAPSSHVGPLKLLTSIY